MYLFSLSTPFPHSGPPSYPPSKPSSAAKSIAFFSDYWCECACVCTCMHTCMYVCVHLLSLFFLVVMCIWLQYGPFYTGQSWRGVIFERLILLLPVIISYGYFIEVGPLKFTLVHISMSINTAITAISRKYYFTAEFLVFWILPFFYPLFFNVSWTIESGALIQMNPLGLGFPWFTNLYIVSNCGFLWQSPFAVKRGFLGWGMIDIFACGYKDQI